MNTGQKSILIYLLYIFITLAISKCYGKVRVLFFRATTRGKSHISRFRGLVVRCLLFNPEIPVGMRLFFLYISKYSEAEGSHFFRHYETFRLCETFFSKFFKCPQRVLLSIFLYCNNECKKSQRVPFLRIFGTETVQNSHFFRNFLMSTKGPPFFV